MVSSILAIRRREKYVCIRLQNDKSRVETVNLLNERFAAEPTAISLVRNGNIVELRKHQGMHKKSDDPFKSITTDYNGLVDLAKDQFVYIHHECGWDVLPQGKTRVVLGEWFESYEKEEAEKLNRPKRKYRL